VIIVSSCNLNWWFVLKVIGLVFLRNFYGKLRNIFIWISFVQFESLDQFVTFITLLF